MELNVLLVQLLQGAVFLLRVKYQQFNRVAA